MCVCVCVRARALVLRDSFTFFYFIYIYIYICVCVCVCTCVRACVSCRTALIPVQNLVQDSIYFKQTRHVDGAVLLIFNGSCV
jgi:hypothetical protein